MNHTKLLIMLILTTGICTPAIFSMQSKTTLYEKTIKTITNEARTIFTIDRKTDGSIDPQSPLYINLSGKNLQSTEILQIPRFQKLVLQQYKRLTGRTVASLTDVYIEINLAHNKIDHISATSFKGYTIGVITVDEKNMLDEEINKLTLNNEIIIIWE